MSIESMAVVLHHSRARGTTKLVLLGIANHEGDGGAYPGVATLARYANTTDRSVQRAVEWLVSHGEVQRLTQRGGDLDWPDHLRPNRYRVMVTCPTWCDRTTHHRDTRAPEVGLTGLSTGLSTPGDNSGRGDASVTGGVTPVSPGGVTPVSPKPSTTTHPPKVVSQLQDTRACRTCGNPESRCQSVQARWAQADRHPYQAVTHASR